MTGRNPICPSHPTSAPGGAGLSGRPLWVGSFALALATALSAAGSLHAVRGAVDELRLAHAGVRTRAILLRAERIRLSAVWRNAQACQVSYSFSAARRTVRSTARMPGDQCPRLRKGTPLVVRYLPSSPETHSLLGSEQKAPSWVWGALGALAAVASGSLLIAVWVSRWRSGRTTRCRA